MAASLQGVPCRAIFTPHGAAPPSSEEITNGSVRLPADKVREVDEQITARAGLRYEAFIQTVLLPQADATPENFNAARTEFAEANMNHAAALRPTLKQGAGCIRIAVGAAHRQAARGIFLVPGENLLVPRGKSRPPVIASNRRARRIARTGRIFRDGRRKIGA